jgi:hypothetical protein
MPWRQRCPAHHDTETVCVKNPEERFANHPQGVFSGTAPAKGAFASPNPAVPYRVALVKVVAPVRLPRANGSPPNTISFDRVYTPSSARPLRRTVHARLESRINRSSGSQSVGFAISKSPPHRARPRTVPSPLRTAFDHSNKRTGLRIASSSRGCAVSKRLRKVFMRTHRIVPRCQERNRGVQR